MISEDRRDLDALKEVLAGTCQAYSILQRNVWGEGDLEVQVLGREIPFGSCVYC